MATRRLYRSRNGEMLGVCKGFAEWRDLPVNVVRLIVIILAISTAVFPALIVYFIIGVILPVNPYEEGEFAGPDGKKGKAYYAKEGEDYEKTNARAESAEDYERRQKENDWDNRFSNS